MPVLPLVLGVIVWYLIKSLKWKTMLFDVMEKIPGPRWYPIVGTFSTFSLSSRRGDATICACFGHCAAIPESYVRNEYLTNVIYKFLNTTMKHKPIYRSWNGNVHEVHLTKPEHIQKVLESSAHHPKGPFYRYLKPWLGNGVFTSEGPKWFAQRKMLTPTFHFKTLEGFIETFGERSKILIEKLSKKADGNYFSVLPLLHTCTLDTICETAMGVSLDKITDKPLEYINNVHDITELAMWRYWKPWITDRIFSLLPQGRRYKRLVKELHVFGDKVVACRKELLRNKSEVRVENEHKKFAPFIDTVLNLTEDQHVFSDSDLKDMVNTFIFAGFETTGNSLGWVLFLLGNHPEIQEMAYREARSVLKDKIAPTTMAEVRQLGRVDFVLRETLRLYPPVVFLTRKTTKDMELDGHRVPAGTQAIIHMYIALRDPEQYPDPEKFIPERYFPETAKKRHLFSYIPFSAGPRSCLGRRFAIMEMLVVTAAIVKTFKITSLHTPEEIKLFAHVQIRPQIELKVKLERRGDVL